VNLTVYGRIDEQGIMIRDSFGLPKIVRRKIPAFCFYECSHQELRGVLFGFVRKKTAHAGEI
jgi:hypothetical protein